jgi:hypothetical protein
MTSQGMFRCLRLCLIFKVVEEAKHHEKKHNRVSLKKLIG